MPLLLLTSLLYQGELFRPYALAEVGVSEEYIFTVPFELSQAFLFDLDGHFIRAIGEQGHGPGEFEFIHLSGILQDHLWAVSGRNPSHVFEFEASGKLVGEVPITALALKSWPYRVFSGWFLLKEEGDTLLFMGTDSHFFNETTFLKVKKPLAKGPGDVAGKRLLWGISRERKTFFYLNSPSKSLWVFDLASGVKTSVDLGQVQAIPDPQGKKDLLGRLEKLPLFTGLQMGPGNVCLIYTGAHHLHPNLPPLVYDANGTKVKSSYSAETWRRLVALRGNDAWVLTFTEDEGAGIHRIGIGELNAFTAATRYDFSEKDMTAYLQARMKKGKP